MTAPLLVPDNLASTGVESLCYGVFITLTIAYAALACMRRDAKAYTRHSQLPMKIGSAVLFLSVTTHWTSTMIRLFEAFAFFENGQAPTLYYADLTRWTLTLKTSSVVVAVLSGDAMMIYRLWVVWGHNIYVCIFPLITEAGLFVCGIGMVNTLSHLNPTTENGIFASAAGQWITSDFVITFVTNIYCTALIAFRIYNVDKHSKMAGVVRLSRINLISALVILVESAAIYTTWTVVCLIVYQCASNALFPVADILPCAAGVSFMLINVRAGLGWAQTSAGAPPSSLMFRVENTAMSTAMRSEEGYNLKPFELEINESVVRETPDQSKAALDSAEQRELSQY
ncbi:hypothetical protein CPB85DRAFT_277264 [Mucidula mucida]|nr:hypothetical protein CPB85DRAFT_277264 [Mucidula mucida]